MRFCIIDHDIVCQFFQQKLRTTYCMFLKIWSTDAQRIKHSRIEEFSIL